MSKCFIDLDEFRIDENLAIYIYGEAEVEYEEQDERIKFFVSQISISSYCPGTGAYVINKSILNERPGCRDAKLFKLIADAVEEDANEDISKQIRAKSGEIQDSAWLRVCRLVNIDPMS